MILRVHTNNMDEESADIFDTWEQVAAQIHDENGIIHALHSHYKYFTGEPCTPEEVRTSLELVLSLKAARVLRQERQEKAEQIRTLCVQLDVSVPPAVRIMLEE